MKKKNLIIKFNLVVILTIMKIKNFIIELMISEMEKRTFYYLDYDLQKINIYIYIDRFKNFNKIYYICAFFVQENQEFGGKWYFHHYTINLFGLVNQSNCAFNKPVNLVDCDSLKSQCGWKLKITY